jgi:hypothetical protein
MTSHCGYCGKGPFLTQGGLNKHIGRSKDCQEKNRLAFKSYTSTIWKNTPDTSNNLPCSPSPPLDETPGDLKLDLLAVEQNVNLESTIETPDLLIPQTEHTNEPQQNQVFTGHYFEEYPSERKAGAAWGKDQPLFERIQKEQRENHTSKWGPFKDQDEWELAEWLSKNVGQKQTDAFLKLNIVSTYSFITMQQAVSLTEQ